MTAEGVVEGLDVVEDHGTGGGAGVGDDVVEALGFQGGPEGLGGGVVVAVAAAAHALEEAEICEGGREVVTGVLTALIAVMNETSEAA